MVQRECIHLEDLKFLETKPIFENVVKLDFDVGAKQRGFATGFFVVIPDSPYEVILTAGHNLWAKTNKPTTDVRVLLPHPNPSSPDDYPISIPSEHIKVSEDFMKDRTKTQADYGVILIPYTGNRPRRGFGFNMTYAFAELRGNAYVSGYRNQTPPGQPVLSNGLILERETTEDQLSYKVETEDGFSGSPVWIVYNKTDITVVAVHNNGPAPGCEGSRGSRLAPKLLRDVFLWADLKTKKQIKAQELPPPPPPLPLEGLYMIFADTPFARIRRGTGGTEFDLFPARTSRIPHDPENRYILALDEKWVMFNVENHQVMLVDMPEQRCLFHTNRPKRVTKNNEHVVYVNYQDKYHLTLGGSGFKPHDLPDAQKSGVQISTEKASPLTFDPYIPFTPLPTAADMELKELCNTCGNMLEFKV